MQDRYRPAGRTDGQARQGQSTLDSRIRHRPDRDNDSRASRGLCVSGAGRNTFCPLERSQASIAVGWRRNRQGAGYPFVSWLAHPGDPPADDPVSVPVTAIVSTSVQRPSFAVRPGRLRRIFAMTRVRKSGMSKHPALSAPDTGVAAATRTVSPDWKHESRSGKEAVQNQISMRVGRGGGRPEEPHGQHSLVGPNANDLPKCAHGASLYSGFDDFRIASQFENALAGFADEVSAHPGMRPP